MTETSTLPPGGEPENGPASDENLLRLHVAGAEGAFSDLLARHESWLFGYIRARTDSTDTASDLFQEVFLRVARSAPRFGFRSKVSTWLFTITRNVLHDHHARKRRDRLRNAVGDGLASFARRFKRTPNQDGEGEPSAAVLEAVPDPRPSPERQLEGALRLTRLRKALAKLPYEQRDVVLLVTNEGLALKDVAERLGMNVNTVKTNLRRGRLRLAQAMTEGGLS